jgi:hypothetical protein
MVEKCYLIYHFKANWKNIKERKKTPIKDSNQRKNAKKISHTSYRVGDVGQTD